MSFIQEEKYMFYIANGIFKNLRSRWIKKHIGNMKMLYYLHVILFDVD